MQPGQKAKQRKNGWKSRFLNERYRMDLQRRKTEKGLLPMPLLLKAVKPRLMKPPLIWLIQGRSADCALYVPETERSG